MLPVERGDPEGDPPPPQPVAGTARTRGNVGFGFSLPSPPVTWRQWQRCVRLVQGRAVRTELLESPRHFIYSPLHYVAAKGGEVTYEAAAADAEGSDGSSPRAVRTKGEPAVPAVDEVEAMGHGLVLARHSAWPVSVICRNHPRPKTRRNPQTHFRTSELNSPSAADICMPRPDSRRTRVRNLAQRALATSNGVLRRPQLCKKQAGSDAACHVTRCTEPQVRTYVHTRHSPGCRARTSGACSCRDRAPHPCAAPSAALTPASRSSSGTPTRALAGIRRAAVRWWSW